MPDRKVAALYDDTGPEFPCTDAGSGILRLYGVSGLPDGGCEKTSGRAQNRV